MDEKERLNRFVELNVIEQVSDLAKTSIVQNAWKNHAELQLHGWVYGIGSGIIKDLEVTLQGEEVLDKVYQLSF